MVLALVLPANSSVTELIVTFCWSVWLWVKCLWMRVRCEMWEEWGVCVTLQYKNGCVFICSSRPSAAAVCMYQCKIMCSEV